MNFHSIVVQSSTFLAITTSVLIVWITILAFFVNDPSPYDEQTARYTYGAIFQGFAAIFAVSFTLVLVALHHISNSNINIEKRISEIIESKSPKNHIPKPIDHERFYVNYIFYHDMLKNLSYTGITSSDCEIIKNEVINLYNKRDVYIHNRSTILHNFKYILPMTIIVMSVGLASLVFATPSGESVDILYLCHLYLILSITLYTAVLLARFFYRINNEWNPP